MSVASMRSRRLVGVFIVGVAALCLASPSSFGQAAPGQQGQPGQPGQGQQGQRGGRGNRGQNGQQRDPAQFRQQFQDRMRETLGATPDEWTLLQPKIEKVQQLQRAASIGRGGMGALFRTNTTNPTDPNANPGGRGGRGNRGNGPNGNDPPSPVATKAQELQTTLQNKDTPPDELKQKLAELRQARTKAKADVVKAQEDLREIVTVRQESVLVTMGILE
jgi:hypothetical protein